LTIIEGVAVLIEGIGGVQCQTDLAFHGHLQTIMKCVTVVRGTGWKRT
jgi:hypothetical protein